MNITDTFSNLLNRGADFYIARENAREDSRLPLAPQTPDEQLVQQSTPAAVVKNGQIVGTQQNEGWKQYVVPVAVSAGAIVVGGLLLSALKNLAKPSKK